MNLRFYESFTNSLRFEKVHRAIFAGLFTLAKLYYRETYQREIVITVALLRFQS